MNQTINHKNLYILILGICIASFPLSIHAALSLPLGVDTPTISICGSTNSNLPNNGCIVKAYDPKAERDQIISAEQPYQTNSYAPDQTNSYAPDQMSSQSSDFPCIEPSTIPLGYNRATGCLLTPAALQRKTAEQTIEKQILETNFGTKLYDYCGKPPYTYSTKRPISDADWMKCAQTVQLNIQNIQTQGTTTNQSSEVQKKTTPQEILIDVSPVANTEAVNVSAPQQKKTIESKIVVPIATSTATTTKPASVDRGLIHRLFGWLGF